MVPAVLRPRQQGKLARKVVRPLFFRRYGLPKPTVKRALLEVYQTVVLDQQRWTASPKTTRLRPGTDVEVS
jgi:hypothetical protein